MRFLVVFKRVHPGVHRELGAGAGELPELHRKLWVNSIQCTGCMDPASDPSKT